MGKWQKNSFHLCLKSAICFQINLPKWPKLENMIPPTPIGRKRRLQRNLLNESYMNIYLLYIFNINVSLLWPIMKAALHFIIHVNGQQRVGTHSGQVGPFYEYHLMIFSFGQQNQVSTTKYNNCIIVFKEKKYFWLCVKVKNLPHLQNHSKWIIFHWMLAGQKTWSISTWQPIHRNKLFFHIH